jgi:hypothetical protein
MYGPAIYQPQQWGGDGGGGSGGYGSTGAPDYYAETAANPIDPTAQFRAYMGAYDAYGPQSQQALNLVRTNAMGGPNSLAAQQLGMGLQQARDVSGMRASGTRGNAGLAQAQANAMGTGAGMSGEAMGQAGQTQQEQSNQYLQDILAQRAQYLQAADLPLQWGKMSLGQQALDVNAAQFAAQQNQANINAALGGVSGGAQGAMMLGGAAGGGGAQGAGTPQPGGDWSGGGYY